MVKETLKKTVKQLKQERTLAKTAFTKQANYLSRAANSMIEHKLQVKFSKLSSLARHVSDENEEYTADLLADNEAVTDEGEEVRQQAPAE